MIYAMPPTIYDDRSWMQICTKIDIGDFEVSISLNNSLGRLPILTRQEIRIFRGEEDVTANFYHDVEELSDIDGCEFVELLNKVLVASGMAMNGEQANEHQPNHDQRPSADS